MILAAFASKPNFPATDQRPGAKECEKAGFVVHYDGAEPTDEEVADFAGVSPRKVRERQIADLKIECQRRILAVYPTHRQINNAGDLEMRAWIDAMRQRCNEIEAGDIPSDFRSDHYWQVDITLPKMFTRENPAVPEAQQFEEMPEPEYMADVNDYGDIAGQPIHEMEPDLEAEPFELPGMFRQNLPGPMPAAPAHVANINEAPSLEIRQPINVEEFYAQFNQAVAEAIDRITSVAVSIEAALKAREEMPPPVPQTVVQQVIRDDGRNEQVLYETALRARNGDVEAMELLRPAAAVASMSVGAMADHIINNRKTLEREILAEFANGVVSWNR